MNMKIAAYRRSETAFETRNPVLLAPCARRVRNVPHPNSVPTWLAAKTMSMMLPKPDTTLTPKLCTRPGVTITSVSRSCASVGAPGGRVCPLLSNSICAWVLPQIRKYTANAATTMSPSMIHGIQRRRIRKISLRSRRSTRRLRFGELDEHVLERARSRNQRTRVETGRRERAVELRAALRLGDDVETGRRLTDALQAEAAQDLRGTRFVLDDDLEIRPAATRDLGKRAARDELALLDDEHA